MVPGLTQYSAIVFDLGDVLFRWSATTETSISPKMLHKVMGCDIWYDYEANRISQAQCYDLLGQRYSLNPQEIRRAFDQAKESLVADHDIVEFVRSLKQMNKNLRIFALSNVSRPDYNALRLKPADWGIFERIFTSGEIGERKPNFGAYNHVITQTGINPHETIFVDDRLENVFAARSLGFRGIIFDDVANVKRTLLNLTCNPLARGNGYLQANAGKLVSIIGKSEEDAVVLHENFSQLLILEVTHNPDLIHLVESKNEFNYWNFFHDRKCLSADEFPYDLDTTSIAYIVFRHDRHAANQVMNQILKHLTQDGLPMTYFDLHRPRIDAGVCACVSTLFYSYGRGAEVQRMIQWIYEILTNRAYLDGTYYYVYPEYFLYAIVRLLSSTDDADLHAKFRPILLERIEERIGVSADSLALAMRIVACNFFGVRDEVDLRTLLDRQCEDGGWETSWVYRLPSMKTLVGNRGLTTAMAVKAIQAFPPPNARVATSNAGAIIKKASQPRYQISALVLLAVTASAALYLTNSTVAFR